MVEPSRGGRRWLILVEDGRHVTVGRNTDPSENELIEMASILTKTGQGGWLVVAEGDYYSPRCSITLLMVRELAPTNACFDQAACAFQVTRRQAIRSV